jgi:hypothetical protein
MGDRSRRRAAVPSSRVAAPPARLGPESDCLMTWRTSTILRITGIACLALGAIFGQRVFLYIGFGFLAVGWMVLFRERRQHRS